MMILAVLSIGVSSLVRTGVETQLSRRVHEYMQVVGLNIVDDLRRDLRTADQAIITAGGNQLTIIHPAGNISYVLNPATGVLTRTQNAQSKDYNPTVQQPRLQVTCPNGPCFTGVRKDPTNPNVLIADNNSPQQVQLGDITVRQQAPAGGGTIIDTAFGAPNFSMRNITLSLTSQTNFR